MEEKNVRKSHGNFWLGLLIGALISAVVSLLYAPRSGSETRALIGEKAKKARDRAADTIDRTKSKISELKGKTADKAEELQSMAEER